MIKVGLTGSIGSGKSLVASVFEHLGIQVYHADNEAKNFLSTPVVSEKLVSAFGNEILDESGKVNRKALALKVFSNPKDLALLNAIIHPLVKEDFERWTILHQNNSYVIQEAAIIYESGFDIYFNKIIVVSAPEDICIQRVMKRDGIRASEVIQRMNNQWDPALKVAKADFVLINDSSQMLLPQVLDLHKKLLDLSVA